MAKTLDEILRQGRTDPAALRELAEKAKKAGLTNKVIHIELDLLTGNLKHQASPMDSIMHLGMIEFYKVTVISGMIGKAISKEKPDEPEAPEPEAAAKPDKGDSEPGRAEPYPKAHVPVPGDAGAPEGGAPSA